jgi:hypothetical protein
VSLEIIVEEERSQVVKKIDLQAMGGSKAISFAVQVQTAPSVQGSEEITPQLQPLTCGGCFHSVVNCICDGTKFA